MKCSSGFYIEVWHPKRDKIKVHASACSLVSIASLRHRYSDRPSSLVDVPESECPPHAILLCRGLFNTARTIMPSFNLYAPLTSAHNFRILELAPGLFHEDVVCRLDNASIPESGHTDQGATYDAVSYTFGPDFPTFEITLDGCAMTVRENLWLLLHYIRDPIEYSYLWIDALCINLTDPQERAFQVRMMDKIYSHACQVLLWLGVDDAYSPTALAIIKRNARMHTKSVIFTSFEYRALLSWCERRYWTRTWL